MNVFFSSMFGDDPLPSLQPLSPNAIQRWIVIGAIGFVVLSAFVWAAFIRKRRRRRKHHHHRRSFAKSAAKGMSEITRHVHERQRRRRSRQRTRNPTLAETGGLPPPRADEPVPQTQPQPPA
jgi:type VI protein secretion system component VasK